MDSYGINSKGIIKIESVATLPAFTSEAADERRVIYTEDTQKVYYASATAWSQFGAGAGITISQASHGFVVGNVLRLNSSTYVLAQANTATNAEVVGIVIEDTDNDHFIMSPGGYVTGLSGLTAGDVHFLSHTVAGVLTTTEPTAGNISKPMLIADSTTSGFFTNYRGTLIP